MLKVISYHASFASVLTDKSYFLDTEKGEKENFGMITKRSRVCSKAAISHQLYSAREILNIC